MTRAVCGDHGVTVGLDWEARLEYRSPERELEFKTRTSSETGTEKPRPLPGRVAAREQRRRRWRLRRSAAALCWTVSTRSETVCLPGVTVAFCGYALNHRDDPASCRDGPYVLLAG